MKLTKQEEVEREANRIHPMDPINRWAFRQGVGYAEKEFAKLFPNGFESWYETFYEIVSTIEYILNDGSPHKVYDLHSKGGSVYIYEHAQELTNEFELLHKDRKWDGDFLDELHNFLNSKWNE